MAESIASPRVRKVANPFARWLGRTWARLSYGYHIEPTWLEVNQHDIPISNWPAAWEGLRIAHLSDLHIGKHLHDSYLELVLHKTRSLEADLIAVTGDFIHAGYKYIERAAGIVGRLRAPLGVYAVLGNHDYSVRNALGIRFLPALHRHIHAALERQGVRVLRNEGIALERGGAVLQLAGVDDLWSRDCDPQAALGNVCPQRPRILLAHNPQTILALGDLRTDLILSGHTHGGQVDWPGLGRIVLGRKARQFAAGLYEYQGRRLYVNKGVGYGFRFRFRVRPEIALLTLRRE